MELKNRYQSLDVFRGIDVALMIIVNTAGDGSTTFSPLLHANWHGFTLTDLVFPTFLFLVGTSMSFSMKIYETAGQRAVLRKILVRMTVIFLIGYIMYWFPFMRQNETGEWIVKPLAGTRIFGVLQRIALCYAIGALVVYFWKLKGAIIFSIVALFGYWLILVVFGDLTLTGNAVLRFDTWLIGERHLYHGEGVGFDPEGLLSTLPAIANVLIGYCAGRFIRENGATFETIAKLMMAGAVLVFAGLAWDLVFPINKKLWTSSFVVYTCGIDLMVMAILLYLIDVLNWKSWTYFFEVLGRNTLFIYLVSEFVAITLIVFPSRGDSFYHTIFVNGFQSWAGGYMGSLLFAVSFMLLCWVVGYWMDKRRIYVKI
ncbi:MAG: heparan-alpha-glucosaminide N-acetyltransferase domain-containing protein [Bacteroidota bacterium]